MNINTCEALLAELQIMQFKFESLNGQNKENNIANIVSTLNKCDIVTPKKENGIGQGKYKIMMKILYIMRLEYQ